MNNILISADRAPDAIRWAMEQFKHFEVQHNFPANFYEFKFVNPEHASMFALKWMQ